jgi:hypothetical protein
MAWPNRSSFFPAGALLPATFKTYLADFYDQVVALLGTAGTPAAALAALGASSLIGRNRIINGNFAINQLGLSGTVILAAGAYGHDGWKAGAAGCTYTFATSGLDTTITITAGSLVQVVEDKNVEGGLYRLSHSGTAQARVAVSGAATSGAYAATPLTTASATANQTVTVEFTTGTVGKVMLEPGSMETAYERRPYNVELERCQRYYETGNFGVYSSYPTGGVGASGGAFIGYRVTKRTAPSVALVSPAYTNASLSTITPQTDGFSIQITNGASAGNFSATGAWTAAARL